jgi:hypothetical protein
MPRTTTDWFLSSECVWIDELVEPSSGANRARSTRKGSVPMIMPFTDSVAGTPVYINPEYVVSVRPDPANPDEVSIVKLRDGESIRVRSAHEEIARKLTGEAAA